MIDNLKAAVPHIQRRILPVGENHVTLIQRGLVPKSYNNPINFFHTGLQTVFEVRELPDHPGRTL